jgi:hypothetical protein
VSNPRTLARHAAIAFIVHAVLAVGILALDQRPAGANIHGWNAVRLLRLADFPVLWAIDGILQHFRIVPLSWFQSNFHVANAVNVALTYVVVGGAFHAALTASVSLWLGRHEPEAGHSPT